VVAPSVVVVLAAVVLFMRVLSRRPNGL